MRAIKPVLIFLVLALTAACYWPGLTGSFSLDDTVNLDMNRALKVTSLNPGSLWRATMSGTAGPLGRPVSMFSFALSFYATGLDAWSYKLTNLAIHLLNGLLVYLVAGQLLKLYWRVRQLPADEAARFQTALALAALWLLHPFNLTSVLYVVQRMTSLAALFSLAGLLMYLHGRERLLDGKQSGWWSIAAAMFIATPLAALSKENGILLPLLLLVIEITLLRWETAAPGARRLLRAMGAAIIVLPLLFALYYYLTHPGAVVGTYVWRDFTLGERLMTETRALWFYLRMIVLPDMTEMGLHHDDFVISKGLLAPWTTLAAIAGLLLLAGAAFVLRRKYPLFSFGVAFFFAGHLLESSIFALELVFEYRNYLPMLGILLPLVCFMLSPRFHPASLRLRRVAMLVMLVMFAGLTAIRAMQWGDPPLMLMLEAERHPDSVRANTDLARFYFFRRVGSPEEALDLYNKAAHHYRVAAQVGTTRIDGLVGLMWMSAERGMAPDPSVVDELESRLASVPFGPPNKNSLLALLLCVEYGICKVESPVIDRLYHASMSNPKLVGKHRKQLVAEFRRLPQSVWQRKEGVKK